MQQQIRFCTGSDGVRLAYAVSGTGPPLLRAPHWITHLEHDDAVWGHLLEALGRRFTLVRFDQRGCGLSDRGAPEISFEAWVRDVESVADAAGLGRFALLGVSQGASIAVAYAARHPERVSHLILYGGYAQGWAIRDLTAHEREKLATLGKLIELGWTGKDPSLRQVFALQFIPGAGTQQARAFSELMSLSASSETALRIYHAFGALDVREEAARVSCPTLVMHSTRDLRVPFEQGRILAGLIPGARFLPLDSENHLLLADEPALRKFLEAVDELVPPERVAAAFKALTAREQAILEHVAQGLDNAQIAARLELSEKTVRNYLVAILDKLQVETRAQAIVLAREAGLGRQSP
ncbi:MAG TPA: alpha/beta fold hydrolase [Burkholderiales bacterium]|jgi:pimeloyl-ACP methyl ester carboxylesterase/DNA-binding CsgD family transcriptional regulator